MPVSSTDPRANQKERTRRALVDAARAQLRDGSSPTVAEAAEAAGVSRATAYRYFPTHQSLLLEAGTITPSTEPVEALLKDLQSADAEERLLALVDRFNPIILEEEIAARSALRTYLDTWLANRRHGARGIPVREGRRMRWLDKVLEPATRKLTDAQFRRLRCALALTLSIDAIVVLKDVCRVDSDKEVLGTLRWAAVALLRAGVAAQKPKQRRARKKP